MPVVHPEAVVSPVIVTVFLSHVFAEFIVYEKFQTIPNRRYYILINYDLRRYRIRRDSLTLCPILLVSFLGSVFVIKLGQEDLMNPLSKYRRLLLHSFLLLLPTQSNSGHVAYLQQQIHLLHSFAIFLARH